MLSTPFLLDLDAAHQHVAARALTDAAPGPVGLELEAHLIDLAAPADRVDWQRVTAVVDTLPALPGGSRVTLEPGGQVELSGPPLAGISAAVAALRADTAVLREVLGAAGLGVAPLGSDPLRPARRVNPGARYRAMEQHFAAVGCPAPGAAMMTSTASLQLNLEAGAPAGWAQRVQLAHRLGPVLVAVSACSPMLAGRETGWRSTRQQVWGELDQARCGPLLGLRDPATEWADYALAAPVMMVAGEDGMTPVLERTPFAAWVRGDVPLGNRRPTVADLDVHLTTLFPPVRLRGFLEIRYLDAAPEPWWPALAAVVATLMDDPQAADAAAAACAPLAAAGSSIAGPSAAGVWTTAAHRGLDDPGIAAAARSCLAVAAERAPAALRREVVALADLVDRGRCPGDDLLHAARTQGPDAALLAATRMPEKTP